MVVEVPLAPFLVLRRSLRDLRLCLPCSEKAKSILGALDKRWAETVAQRVDWGIRRCLRVVACIGKRIYCDRVFHQSQGIAAGGVPGTELDAAASSFSIDDAVRGSKTNYSIPVDNLGLPSIVLA